jgi:hypothetical protein
MLDPKHRAIFTGTDFSVRPELRHGIGSANESKVPRRAE